MELDGSGRSIFAHVGRAFEVYDFVVLYRFTFAIMWFQYLYYIIIQHCFSQAIYFWEHLAASDGDRQKYVLVPIPSGKGRAEQIGFLIRQTPCGKETIWHLRCCSSGVKRDRRIQDTHHYLKRHSCVKYFIRSNQDTSHDMNKY